MLDSGGNVTGEIQAVLAGRRIGVLGLEAGQAVRVSQALSTVRALSVETASPVCGRESFDALIVSLAAVEDPRIAHACWQSQVPILVTGSGSSLAQGVAAAYSWACELLAEPWSEPELLMRVFRLLAPAVLRPKHYSARPAPLVLVADDDSSLLSLLVAILKGHGTACYVAKNGLQALQLTRELIPNLLVLDIDMPVMNGFEVLETIRRQPGLESVLVALLTGCDHPDDVRRGGALGADDYIVKPVHPLMLANRIKRMLRSSRLEPVNLPS